MECLRAARVMAAMPAEKRKRDGRDPGETCSRGPELRDYGEWRRSRAHPQQSAYRLQFAQLLPLRVPAAAWLASGGAYRRFHQGKWFPLQLAQTFQHAARQRP